MHSNNILDLRQLHEGKKEAVEANFTIEHRFNKAQFWTCALHGCELEISVCLISENVCVVELSNLTKFHAFTV